MNFLLCGCQPHVQFLLYAGMACLRRVVFFGLGSYHFLARKPNTETSGLGDTMSQSRRHGAFRGVGMEGAEGRVSWLCLRDSPNGCHKSVAAVVSAFRQ